MRERAIRFGKATPLIGVLADGRRTAGDVRPGIIFISSGILHHVGACRLHVRLARLLAEDGFTSLRFDLSGVGDSEVRKDSLPFEKSAVREVREAMDYLQDSKGIREFLLVGLCSGADVGFAASQQDPRVVGLAQLDAYAYRTPRFYFHYYAPRVTSLAMWRSYLKRKLTGVKPTIQGADRELTDDYVQSDYRRVFPPKAEVEAGLRTLVGRGVHLLFLFSGGQGDHYNHREQYQRSFGSIDFGDRLSVEYFGDADHLFSAPRHQTAVDSLIADWARRIAEQRACAGVSPVIAAVG